MKVMMILPLTVTGIGGITQIPNLFDSARGFSLFVDMQATLVDLKMHRYLVEHQIPGREGGKLQDLGSASSVITIRGKWIYENRPERDVLNLVPVLKLFTGQTTGWNWVQMQMFQQVYRFKEPLYFASDLITTVVMIEDFEFKYEGGKPNVYDYTMILKEVDPRLTLISMAGSQAVRMLNIIPEAGVGF